MVVAALSFVPARAAAGELPYWQFAVILFLNGLGKGLFASPNRAGIMNSLPPERRGVGAGMSTTFKNSAMVLSIGIFFTLIILGPGFDAARRPSPRPGRAGRAAGRRGPARRAAAGVDPVRRAARLQPDPARCSGPSWASCRASHAAYLTGHTFFPSLISAPFQHGLDIAFDFAIAACLIAAVASLLRGGRYVYDEHGQARPRRPTPARTMARS